MIKSTLKVLDSEKNRFSGIFRYVSWEGGGGGGGLKEKSKGHFSGKSQFLSPLLLRTKLNN